MSETGVLPSVAVEGAGPPLLLLHGGPGLTDYMGLLGSEVAGWRCVRYQQRGHAPSSTTGPFSVEQHVADLVSVLDAATLERTVVLGHSWGGHLALHAALDAPERIAALVLVDPFGSVDDGGAVALGTALNERLLPEVRARAAMVDERLAGPEPTDDDVTEFVTLRWPGYFADPAAAPAPPPGFRVSLACNAETMGSAFSHLEGSVFADRLHAVEVPVILVLGDHSPLPVEIGRQTAARLARAEVVIVPNAGHLPWHEVPGCVRAALSKVVQALA